MPYIHTRGVARAPITNQYIPSDNHTAANEKAGPSKRQALPCDPVQEVLFYKPIDSTGEGIPLRRSPSPRKNSLRPSTTQPFGPAPRKQTAPSLQQSCLELAKERQASRAQEREREREREREKEKERETETERQRQRERDRERDRERERQREREKERERERKAEREEARGRERGREIKKGAWREGERQADRHLTHLMAGAST